MQCAVCKTQTSIGQAYMLPIVERVNGNLKNLVACCKECCAHWLATHPTYATNEVRIFPGAYGAEKSHFEEPNHVPH